MRKTILVHKRIINFILYMRLDVSLLYLLLLLLCYFCIVFCVAGCSFFFLSFHSFYLILTINLAKCATIKHNLISLFSLFQFLFYYYYYLLLLLVGFNVCCFFFCSIEFIFVFLLLENELISFVLHLLLNLYNVMPL